MSDLVTRPADRYEAPSSFDEPQAILSAAAAAVHAADGEERRRHALGDRYDDVRRSRGKRSLHGRRLEGAIPLGVLTPALIAWTLDGGVLFD